MYMQKIIPNWFPFSPVLGDYIDTFLSYFAYRQAHIFHPHKEIIVMY